MRHLVSLLFVVAMNGLPAAAYAQSASTVVVTDRKWSLPKEENGRKFKSWTIFVVCRPDWVGDNKSLSNLKENFFKFGTAIGKDNSAVWFDRANGEYDFDVSAEICGSLKLDSSLSPYLITTTDWPQSASDIKKKIMVSFGKSDPETVNEIITVITTQVLTQEFDQAKTNTAIWWVKWNAIGRQIVGALSPVMRCVSFNVNTRVFQVGYSPSKSSDCR